MAGMIAQVRGPVVEIALDHAVVDCAGVGYRVLLTPSTLANLQRGAETTLLTSMVVREDSMTLYGFTEPDARELFVLLQTVNGVGPRLAMAVLAVLEPDTLRRALADEDTKTLSTVPGVGKKVAERLGLELRTKVDRGDATSPGAPAGGLTEHVAEALVGLGFTAAAAERAVAAVLADQPSGDPSVVLRAALSRLGKS